MGSLGRREAVVLVALTGLVLALDASWPGVSSLVFLTPLLLVVLVPASTLWGLVRGLRLKSRADWRIAWSSDQILVHRGVRCIAVVPFSRVASGLRVVSVESLCGRFLDDALTLKDARGRVVLRCPGSATGVHGLLRELENRGVGVVLRDLEA